MAFLLLMQFKAITILIAEVAPYIQVYIQCLALQKLCQPSYKSCYKFIRKMYEQKKKLANYVELPKQLYNQKRKFWSEVLYYGINM